MPERKKKLPGDLYKKYAGEFVIYLGQNVVCSSARADGLDVSAYDSMEHLKWGYDAKEDRH